MHSLLHGQQVLSLKGSRICRETHLWSTGLVLMRQSLIFAVILVKVINWRLIGSCAQASQVSMVNTNTTRNSQKNDAQQEKKALEIELSQTS